ncbi:MAG: hypothetical protein LBH58_11940, partial [Tannerellaceae bacterium]|nr:hypothetical protein [Tannerellaceae bacterium]
QWHYDTANNIWQRNSEFTPDGNTSSTTTTTRKSAVILLVLDCSSSLGNQFSTLQNNANNFINTIATRIGTVQTDEAFSYFDYRPIGAVTINGVHWATRNVDAPGTFAASPESAGRFYQWNRKKDWPATGSVSGWDTSTPSGTTWAAANDPSPAGWRVPTLSELQTLLDTDKVSHVWTTVNGVNGRRFTDKATGASIFLPAVGYRNRDNGTLNGAGRGEYWSGTHYDSNYAYILYFTSVGANASYTDREYGVSIRCVAK